MRWKEGGEGVLLGLEEQKPKERQYRQSKVLAIIVGFSRSGPITMLWGSSDDQHFPAKKTRGPAPERFLLPVELCSCVFLMIPLVTAIGE